MTTAAAAAAVGYATGSVSLAAAVGTGGFLIDLDHVVDYVAFERQRDLRPGAFLRYYVEGRIQRAVLVLHSYELFAVLALMAWWTEATLLSGYLVGALMHLALDIIFNGRVTPYSIAAFYSFTYRAWHRFDASALLGIAERRVAEGFWGMFFDNGQQMKPLPGAARRAADAADVAA